MHRPHIKKLQNTKKTIAADSTKKKENFLDKLNTPFVSDNKLFCKTVKPFFSNKGSHRGNIKLVEGDKLLQNDSEVAEELNFFKKAVLTLNVNENSYIKSYKQAYDKIVNQNKFFFKTVSKLDIENEV